MTSYLLAFAIITSVLNAPSAKQHDSSSEEDSEYNGEIIEIMKKIETENIRSKILKQLGRDTPPTFTKSVTPLSNDVIQMLIGSNKEEQIEEEEEKPDEMFFFPVNNDFECQKYDISFCQKFEFKISSDVKTSSSEFWAYKLKSWPFNNVTITVLCSHAGKDNQTEEIFPNDDIRNQWIFFHLSAINDIQAGQGNVTCEIEVKGIVMDSHNLPFLKMVRSKESRTRRDISNDTIKDNGCKIVPFNVSFDDLGIGSWVIYPHVYQANTCIGYCSHVNNHHEYFLSKIFKEHRKNETQCEHNCWFTCCKPKSYKTLELLYWEKEGVITRKNMTDMIVSSCSCM